MKKSSSKGENAAMPAMERDWRVEGDADTLRRAGEIMADKGRMNAAKAHMHKSMQAMERAMGATGHSKPRAAGLGFAKGKR